MNSSGSEACRNKLYTFQLFCLPEAVSTTIRQSQNYWEWSSITFKPHRSHGETNSCAQIIQQSVSCDEEHAIPTTKTYRGNLFLSGDSTNNLLNLFQGNCSVAMLSEIENVRLKVARVIHKFPQNVLDSVCEVLDCIKQQHLGSVFKRRLVIDVFKSNKGSTAD